uniref:CAF17 C-terminal domain-containing protein n=2 Tax=Lygus hesperus TaxID=30085 RepID=A0A0K8TIX0_LYGHE
MDRLTVLGRILNARAFSRVFANLRFCSSKVEVDEDAEVPSKKQKIQQVMNVHPVVAERVKTRSVLAVCGRDSIDFLNNLTTNQLNQLNDEAACLHTYFLNSKGRIIHDALIYKPDDDDTLFIECDISSLQALQTHLIMYRARTNVEIRSVEQEVGVWAVYDPLEIDGGAEGTQDSIHDTSFLDDLDLGGKILLSRDPRMWPLGLRILAPREIDVAQSLKIAGVKITDAPNGTYKSVRYKLGVAEGIAEIGYGRSLPAEINGDYTNAICLSKTNYTGWAPGALKKMVENRMLPLMFHGNPAMVSANSPITDRRGKKSSPIGYLRGVQGFFGLGLMNIPSVLSDRYCIVGKVETECVRPPWWKNEVKSSDINELKEIPQRAND